MASACLGFDCGICQDATELTIGTLNSCEHSFCFQCLQTWLQQCSSTCPICKSEVTLLRKHVLEEPINGKNKSYQQIYATLPPPVERLPVEARQLDANAAPDAADVPTETCEICGIDEHDHLCMLCDSCDRGFHTYCVGLGAMVPPGTWYCPDCHIPEMLPPDDYEEDYVAMTDIPPPQRRVRALAPAPHPSLQRASRNIPVPVTRRTQRTAPPLPHVSSRQLIGAAHHERVRGAFQSRPPLAMHPDGSSASDDERETMAQRSEALARDTAHERARAAAVPANRVLARNRSNWEDIRAGVAHFSDPVGTTLGRQTHDALQVGSRDEAAARLRAAEAMRNGNAPRRQMRPHEKPVRNGWDSGHDNALPGSLQGSKGSVSQHRVSASPAQRLLSSPHPRQPLNTGDVSALCRSRPSTSNPPARATANEDSRGETPRADLAVSWPGPGSENPLKRRSPQDGDTVAGSPLKQVRPMSPEWPLPSQPPPRNGYGAYRSAYMREGPVHKPPTYSTSVHCGALGGVPRPPVSSFARPMRPVSGPPARDGFARGEGAAEAQQRSGRMLENRPLQSQARGKQPSTALPDVPSDSPPLRSNSTLPQAEVPAPVQRGSPLNKRCTTVVRKLLRKAEPLLFADAFHPEDFQALLSAASQATGEHLASLQHPVSDGDARNVAERLVREIDGLVLGDRKRDKLLKYVASEVQEFSSTLA